MHKDMLHGNNCNGRFLYDNPPVIIRYHYWCDGTLPKRFRNLFIKNFGSGSQRDTSDFQYKVYKHKPVDVLDGIIKKMKDKIPETHKPVLVGVEGPLQESDKVDYKQVEATNKFVTQLNAKIGKRFFIFKPSIDSIRKTWNLRGGPTGKINAKRNAIRIFEEIRQKEEKKVTGPFELRPFELRPLGDLVDALSVAVYMSDLDYYRAHDKHCPKKHRVAFAQSHHTTHI